MCLPAAALHALFHRRLLQLHQQVAAHKGGQGQGSLERGSRGRGQVGWRLGGKRGERGMGGWGAGHVSWDARAQGSRQHG